MKYVCKDKFIKVLPLGHGIFSVLEFDVGDILEYIGMDENKLCDFVTADGRRIKLTLAEANNCLEEAETSRFYKFSGLLNRLSKIESEVAELREELESVLRETE